MATFPPLKQNIHHIQLKRGRLYLAQFPVGSVPSQLTPKWKPVGEGPGGKQLLIPWHPGSRKKREKQQTKTHHSHHAPLGAQLQPAQPPNNTISNSTYQCISSLMSPAVLKSPSKPRRILENILDLNCNILQTLKREVTIFQLLFTKSCLLLRTSAVLIG